MVINDTVCIPVTRRSLSIIHLLFSRKNLFPQTTIAVVSGTIAIIESDGIIIQVINEVEAAMGAESDDDYREKIIWNTVSFSPQSYHVS